MPNKLKLSVSIEPARPIHYPLDRRENPPISKFRFKGTRKFLIGIFATFQQLVMPSALSKRLLAEEKMFFLWPCAFVKPLEDDDLFIVHGIGCVASLAVKGKALARRAAHLVLVSPCCFGFPVFLLRLFRPVGSLVVFVLSFDEWRWVQGV